MRRALPVALVLAVVALDAAGARDLALYALLAAIAAAFAAALATYAALVDARAARRPAALAGAQAFLWAVAVVALVGGAAARAPVVLEDGVPPVGRSAVGLCLLVFALKAALLVPVELPRLVARLRTQP
jgi:hypothetical protein